MDWFRSLSWAIVALCALATKRLPSLSIASPCGAFSPTVVKMEPAPVGGNFWIDGFGATSFETNKFPSLSKAIPVALATVQNTPRETPVAETFCTVPFLKHER